MHLLLAIHFLVYFDEGAGCLIGFGLDVVHLHFVHVAGVLANPEDYIVVSVHLEWDTIRDPEKTRELIRVVLHIIPAFQRKNVHLLLPNSLVLRVKIKIILIRHKQVLPSEFYEPVTAEPIGD